MLGNICKFVSKTKTSNLPKKDFTYYTTSYRNKLNETYKQPIKQYEKTTSYKNRLHYKNFVKIIEPITSYRDKRNNRL
tara:strand:- start:813 stop:1046 length:234 start_codon:yes stop_codon:yes gene_type:complete